ncbi:S1/P1 nuclease [Cognatiluteimonas profundi]|uniref:S1/P1 nuclease n=1 Tax=Cognatiluteimonas profundi TaxID=2594501 RepID=UPI00131CCD6B|nr:S1/P1 nuclease [Lysobacter profundi]
MPRLPVLLLLLVLSPAAMAWSALGHRLVGDLAQRHVRPGTRSQIQLLLAGERDPTLAGIAQWADDLRYSDTSRFRATSRWHYISMDDGCRYDPPRDCPDGNCVIGAIRAQRSILADASAAPQSRRDALKFLVHLVADAHQPLHAGGHRDKGGNRFQVNLRTDHVPPPFLHERYVDGVLGTNLHAIWDYDVLASAGLGERPYADRLAAAPWPPVAAANANPAVWAGESCRLVDARALYPAAHAMDSRYLIAQRPLAELRIRQAAYRLAALLDDALDH